MYKTTEKTIYQLVGEYANMLGQYGPESVEVHRFRETHSDNGELMRYANSLDRIKRHLKGKKPAVSNTEKLVGQ